MIDYEQQLFALFFFFMLQIVSTFLCQPGQAKLSGTEMAEINPPLVASTRNLMLDRYTLGTPMIHTKNICSNQYPISVEEILNRICFVLEVLKITITHH